jgi:UDP-N-acetylglucosamine 1-carboxyvinyltransferase
MGRLVIQGGRTVSGTHAVSGNKNAVLPMIAATLLTSEPVTLANVPDISDVEAMLEAAKTFGARVSRDRAARTVTLATPKLRSARIDAALAAKLRTSFLFAGPLLARAGRAALPPPGGDAIGHRRLDTHFAGFKALGAKAKAGRKSLSFRGELRGARILLDEASVTATENILMASVLAKGRTEIYNAACEPHIADLARMLNAMGAKISGAGSNRISVEGVASLGGCTARVGCDYIEAGSYIAAAAVTGGELLLTGIDPEPFEVLEGAFRRFGVTWTISVTEKTLRYVPKKRLRMRYDLGDAIPSVADGTWPAFPSDLMSILIVLASQTRGTCLFFEKMFESRLYFVDQLRQMGAKIVQCDPHRVVVTGPSPLYGGTFSSPDIRAGIALVIAALAARGTSTILNAEVVDRGYVAVEGELAALGANIVRA